VQFDLVLRTGFLGLLPKGLLDQFIDQLAEGNAAGFPASSSLGVSAHCCQVLCRYSLKRLRAETRQRGQVALS